ncbi:hypothetical protein [Chelonobacter oris]|nr:hypothetical protein [Chelonobacter oris]
MSDTSIYVTKTSRRHKRESAQQFISNLKRHALSRFKTDLSAGLAA